MEIIVSSEGSKSFQKIEPGNYIARCVSMVLMGTFDEEFQGVKKKCTKIRLSWETPTELAIFDKEKGEQPFLVSKDFTLSLHEKSSLRKFLESWRGKGFTEEEVKRFDMSKLLTAACMLNVIHKATQKGNTYADIASISAMPKGMICPQQINPTVIFSVIEPDMTVFESFPDWLKERIQQSDEWKARTTPNAVETPSEYEMPNDDLPFK